jgi:hypothetical protein
MNQSQIRKAVEKIEKCKRGGYLVEAQALAFHLNVQLVKFILSSRGKNPVGNRKFKSLLGEFSKQLDTNHELQGIISKKNLKAIKPWQKKMDAWFKSLRTNKPVAGRSLLAETEKIFLLLNISATKVMINGRKS